MGITQHIHPIYYLKFSNHTRSCGHQIFQSYQKLWTSSWCTGQYILNHNATYMYICAECVCTKWTRLTQKWQTLRIHRWTPKISDWEYRWTQKMTDSETNWLHEVTDEFWNNRLWCYRTLNWQTTQWIYLTNQNNIQHTQIRECHFCSTIIN